MSLPKRNDKEYLQIEPSQEGCRISGQKEHTEELAVLFAQYGITCQNDGEGVLRFDPDVDRLRVAELLDSYKQAKGSRSDPGGPAGQENGSQQGQGTYPQEEEFLSRFTSPDSNAASYNWTGRAPTTVAPPLQSWTWRQSRRS